MHWPQILLIALHCYKFYEMVYVTCFYFHTLVSLCLWVIIIQYFFSSLLCISILNVSGLLVYPLVFTSRPYTLTSVLCTFLVSSMLSLPCLFVFVQLMCLSILVFVFYFDSPLSHVHYVQFYFPRLIICPCCVSQLSPLP